MATEPAVVLGPTRPVHASFRLASPVQSQKRMFPTIRTRELEHVTGAGGSSGIKHPLSPAPAITGTASPSLMQALESIKRPGFDFAVAK
jgi:hypothetical protein